MPLTAVDQDGEWPIWPEDLALPPSGMAEAQWRLKIADAMRSAANTAFREGAWAVAIRKYTHALRCVERRRKVLGKVEGKYVPFLRPLSFGSLS